MSRPTMIREVCSPAPFSTAICVRSGWGCAVRARGRILPICVFCESLILSIRICGRVIN